ncbi:hypothetical protein L227DRAFT_605649 [Lentinus tigrinus ALCF2SS1-6]|uniref:Uncharacterized protein n=1 Tax=Lentinus tigrinus ALCF2SS1-6 TaxID=1328759 RepID=A0A5C2SWD1_9APHY|nr:hypothetical protein L227DRAFT_605649 [Lentinus tigrinus ALCF2SS1-6]
MPFRAYLSKVESAHLNPDTLAKYEAQDDPVTLRHAIFCHAKPTKEVYCQFGDAEAPAAGASAAEASTSAPAAAAPAPVSPRLLRHLPQPPPKLKKVDEMLLSKSIEDLVCGKSTMQNEIIGSLGKHTSTPSPVSSVARFPVASMCSPSRSISRSPGVSGPPRTDSLRLLAATVELPNRLGSEEEERGFPDGLVSIYPQRLGISSSYGAAAGREGGRRGAVIDSEEFLKFQSNQGHFAAHQLELWMRHLGRDSRAGEIKYDTAKASCELQARLDALLASMVAFDALLIFYDIILGHLTTVDVGSLVTVSPLCTAPTHQFVICVRYYIDQCDPERGETYKIAKQFGQQLIDNCREVVGQPPLYKDVTFSTAPPHRGHRDCVQRIEGENVRKLETYVEETASGDTIALLTNVQKNQGDVLKPWNVVTSQPELSEEQKDQIKVLHCRQGAASSPQAPNWEYSGNLTGMYLDILHEIPTKDMNALLTSIGKGSIGVKILKVSPGSSGAHVVITTSLQPRDCSRSKYYQGIIQGFGREIDGLDDKSELAHRIMLLILLRLLGVVKKKETSRHFATRPTVDILPLSPSLVLFGNDGLYSELRILLEALF